MIYYLCKAKHSPVYKILFFCYAVEFTGRQKGNTAGLVVSPSASQSKRPGFECRLEPSCVRFGFALHMHVFIDNYNEPIAGIDSAYLPCNWMLTISACTQISDRLISWSTMTPIENGREPTAFCVCSLGCCDVFANFHDSLFRRG